MSPAAEVLDRSEASFQTLLAHDLLHGGVAAVYGWPAARGIVAHVGEAAPWRREA